eukprot:TRINITY_DN5758_c0_g1_i2.p1 TRINITY_DN5758_c0_g1~~TRINITY_DN5758_c0_g1_i2.p1  ORF type:complete len:139 (+),score=8.47 TRINITY_DN5758_c0_g1_i2:43-417(+)
MARGAEKQQLQQRGQQEEVLGVDRDVLATGRAACYAARDAFYRCLDSTRHKTPTEVGYVGLMYPADCKPARAEYLKSCRPTWVKHFDRQYSAQKRLRRLLDQDTNVKGPISLPQASTFINKPQV